MSKKHLTIKMGSKKLKIGYGVYGSGPALLLIHGIPGSSACWNDAIEFLADHFNVIVPALIGFGESDRSNDITELWADSQATAMRQLIDHLKAKELVVVGHDYGGPISLALYSQAPELFKKLVLISTNTFTDTPIPFPLSGIFFPLIGRHWEKLLFSKKSLAMMVRGGFKVRTKKPLLDNYLGDPKQSEAIAAIFSTALREINERYAPIERSLASIKVPVKIIWGDQDPFFSVAQGKRTAELCKGKFVLLSGAGHFLPDELPDRISEEVRTFALG